MAESLKPEDKSGPQIIFDKKNLHPQQLVQMDDATILMVFATAEKVLKVATLTLFCERWSCYFDEVSLLKGHATLLHKINSQTILVGAAEPPCLYILKLKAGRWAVSNEIISFKSRPRALLDVNPKTLFVANDESGWISVLRLEEGNEGETKCVMETEKIVFSKEKAGGGVYLLQVGENTVFVSFGGSYLTVLKQKDSKWFNTYQNILMSRINTGSLWLKDSKTVLVKGLIKRHGTIITEVIKTSKGWLQGNISVMRDAESYYYCKQIFPNPDASNHYFYKENVPNCSRFCRPILLEKTIIKSQAIKDSYEPYFRINSKIDLFERDKKFSCPILFKASSKSEQFFKSQLFNQLTHQRLSDLYFMNS